MLEWISYYFSTFFFSVGTLECYSNKDGTQHTFCSGALGFRTCFTKYDSSKQTKWHPLHNKQYFLQMGMSLQEDVPPRTKYSTSNVRIMLWEKPKEHLRIFAIAVFHCAIRHPVETLQWRRLCLKVYSLSLFSWLVFGNWNRFVFSFSSLSKKYLHIDICLEVLTWTSLDKLHKFW